MSARWVLAVDFGTSFTTAAIDVGDGPRLVEVDGSWRVLSAVLRTPDGSLVVGAPALNQAALRADAFEASYADPSLQAEGIAEGTVIRLGPDRTEVTVVGFVDDIRYAGQGSLWGSLDTWRGVLNINRPGESSGEGVVQALVVRGADGTEGDLTEPIDAATGGSTSTLSIAGAIEALPGVEQQRSVFNQIIGVTVVIAIVVVALFFALLTVERTVLYGVLKALGAGSRTLFAGAWCSRRSRSP